MDYLISVSIAILLSMFDVYAANVLTGYDKLTNPYCSYFVGTKVEVEEEAACLIKRQNYDNVEYWRHLLLLMFGIITVLASIIFVKTNSVKLGVGFAGIITLLIAFITYWSKYGDRAKLFITGVGVICIVAAAIAYANKDKKMIK
jgi:hypothetical protein